MNCRTEKAPDGHEIPIIQDGGEIHLGSRSDDSYAAVVWCDHNINEGISILVLFGMGDLQIIAEASRRLRERVIVYEPSREIYEQMVRTSRYLEIKENPRVICTNSLDEYYRQIARVCNDEALDSACFLIHPGYDRPSWASDVDDIRQTMDRFIDRLTRTRASIYGALDFIILNELRNIILMRDGVLLSRLREWWNPNVPVIIVGAGPSLKKNVDELRRVGNNACIICMDTALTTLQNAGVKPHILATVDVEKKIEVFGDIDKIDVPIAVTANSRADVINQVGGIRIWCKEPHVFSHAIRKSIESEEPRFPLMDAVSGLVMSIALELGTKRIIFVGQDLAFSPEGKSHSDVRVLDYVKDDAYRMEGYYGGVVYSKEDWSIMKRQIEDSISGESNRTYINATEGGVRIRGTKQMPLRQVVDELREIKDDWYCVLKNPKVHISEEEHDKLIQRLETELEQLDEISKLGHDGVFYNPNYIRPPVFDLLLIVMRSREERTRQERFERAIEKLKGYISQVKEEYHNGWFKGVPASDSRLLL